MPEPTTLAAITKANVKAYHNIATTNTDYDALIDAHLPGVIALVQSFCRHDFLSQSRASEKPIIQRNDSEFYLKYYPVASITSLTENGTAMVEDTDYTVDKVTGRVSKLVSSGIDSLNEALPGAWNYAPGSVIVTYVGGHALTDDVSMAIYEMVGIDCGLKKRTYTDNEGVERVATLAAYPKHVEQILKRHQYRGFTRW